MASLSREFEFSGSIIPVEFDPQRCDVVPRGTAAVLRPKTTEDLVHAIHFAQEHGTGVWLNSGIHGARAAKPTSRYDDTGASTGGPRPVPFGMFIDMQDMNTIEPANKDARRKRLRVGAGTTWKQVVEFTKATADKGGSYTLLPVDDTPHRTVLSTALSAVRGKRAEPLGRSLGGLRTKVKAFTVLAKDKSTNQISATPRTISVSETNEAKGALVMKNILAGNSEGHIITALELDGAKSTSGDEPWLTVLSVPYSQEAMSKIAHMLLEGTHGARPDEDMTAHVFKDRWGLPIITLAIAGRCNKDDLEACTEHAKARMVAMGLVPERKAADGTPLPREWTRVADSAAAPGAAGAGSGASAAPATGSRIIREYAEDAPAIEFTRAHGSSAVAEVLEAARAVEADADGMDMMSTHVETPGADNAAFIKEYLDVIHRGLSAGPVGGEADHVAGATDTKASEDTAAATSGVSTDDHLSHPDVSVMSVMRLWPRKGVEVTVRVLDNRLVSTPDTRLHAIMPAATRRAAFRVAPVAAPHTNPPAFLATPLVHSQFLHAESGAVSHPPDLAHALDAQGFQGTAIYGNSDTYAKASKQYARSSYPGRVAPYCILYPGSDADRGATGVLDTETLLKHGNAVTDIQRAVKAVNALNEGIKDEDKRYHITVRSGGHQYSGWSSGGPYTVVISLDKAPFNCMKYHLSAGDANPTTVTVTPGCRLLDVATANKANHVTFPHGECPRVCVGGHIHTGGFGHAGRSFGLALDWVQGFQIVLANGTSRDVERPAVDAAPDLTLPNDKLFYAVLGGGPGSFGIVTKITMALVSDNKRPWPGSATLIAGPRNAHSSSTTWLYERTLLQRTLTAAQSWTNGDAGEDVDLFITVANNIKQVMLIEMLYADDGKRADPAWDRATDPVFKPLLTQLRNSASWWNGSVFRGTELSPTSLSAYAHSGVRTWPLGTTCDGREFAEPYVKRVNAIKGGLTDAFVAGLPVILEEALDTSGVNLIFQLFIGGGMASENPARRHTALPHRDTTATFAFDLFYKPGRKPAAEALQQRMLTLLQESKTEHVRMLWGSYTECGETADDSTDMNIVHEHYYNGALLPAEAGKYALLQEIKGSVDPHDLFHTPFNVQLP